MGVYTRTKDIVNANINAALDKAKIPESMIRLMIQQMEDSVVELKSSCSEKTAAVAQMVREKTSLAEALKGWETRAKMAVESGRDDLARDALHEKKSCLNRTDCLDKEIAFLNGIIKESKDSIFQLEEKLEEASQKYRLLIQRGIHARDRKAARETLRYASGTDAIRRFDEMENRIERMEAEADLAGSWRSGKADLEDQFNRMENSCGRRS